MISDPRNAIAPIGITALVALCVWASEDFEAGRRPQGLQYVNIPIAVSGMTICVVGDIKPTPQVFVASTATVTAYVFSEPSSSFCTIGLGAQLIRNASPLLP